MKLVGLKGLRRYCTTIGLVGLLLCGRNATATNYNYPGPPNSATAPFQFTSSGDTLTVTSGTMESAAGVGTAYTVDFSLITTNAGGISVTLNQGAAMSYLGSSSGAATLNSARGDTGTTVDTLNINGSLSSGDGLYAISLKNTVGTTAADTYNINVGTTGSITGAISTNGVFAVTLDISGSGSSSSAATINGVINLGTSSLGTSTLLIGGVASTTFTPSESIENISNLHITNSSTMTLGVTNTNIAAVNIDPGSTLNVNATLNGLASADGNITNNGTMNIAAAIAKTGTFSGTGTNVVTEGAATGLTISTSNYTIKNHTAVMVDMNNYGNITLPTANFALSGSSNDFTVEYGSGYNGTSSYSYSPGYLAGGTYTLVTTTTGTITTPAWNSNLPSSTLFLSFATPVVNGNTIQITLTRTPFTSYATTALTQSIASNLESIGISSPSQDMLNVLDAVELSTSASSVEFALRQLAPLANAPYYGYELQNECMRIVKLRLADLHDNNRSYFAGDFAADTHLWTKVFGAYANQQAKDDSLGYYGNGGGVAFGIDRDLDDHYTLGAAFVYALSHVDDKVNAASTTQIKSYIGMAYGTYNFSDSEYLDWILAITANNFTASRFIDINNSYIQTATSAYSSQQIAAKGIIGENYEAFGFMQLTPEAYAQYMFAKQYPYEESGAAGANLNISRTNTDMVTLAVGGKAGIPMLLDPGIMMPEIHGWVYYNPVTGKQNTIFSFVDGGGPITSIFNPARTGLTFGAALTIAVIDKLEVKLNFDLDIEDRYNAYYAYLNLRYSF